MAENRPVLVKHQGQGNEAAIVFVHGFGGDASETWGRFPELVAAEPAMSKWDIYSVGYATKLRFDLVGFWEADPDIPTLAIYLRTICKTPPLDQYKSLALVAHSMGGLVVQRALVEYEDLSEPVSHVFLFGTPSAGLRKVSLFRWMKRQVRDMAADKPFIKGLREKWGEKFGRRSGKTPPFKFWSVAGDRDEFVPVESSLAAFPREDFPETELAVVPGNHLEIVKPPDADNKSFQLLLKGLRGRSGAAGPWNGAAVAVESRDFRRAVAVLEPNKEKLDADALVQLALALEGVGRTDDALKVLENPRRSGTDAMGVLAGRLKRRWIAERREEDAVKARELYAEAYRLSVEANDPDQAFYHGINIAFMDLAYASSRTKAKALASDMAKQVLAHCANAQPSMWRYATEGEARLMLGDTDAALDSYQAYIAEAPRPREVESTYQQAKKVADLMGNKKAGERLDAIFHGGV